MSQPAERSDAQMVDLMEQAFSSAEEVFSTVEGPGWDSPTDCPAWSVKDLLSHLAAFEAIATGAPPPPGIDKADFAHVTNEFQEITERGVQARRTMEPATILEEYRSVTSARMAQLRALDEQGWTSNVPTPLGERPQRPLLPIRLLDVFYHEQDVRRALDKPGHLDGEVARFVVQRMAEGALPFVVAKQAEAPEGTVVRLEVSGEAGGVFHVGVVEGKGVVADGGDPTVTFTTDVEAFLCLMGGRWTPQRTLDDGRLKVAGDGALAERILAKVSVIP